MAKLEQAGPVARYRDLVEAGRLKSDPGQLAVAAELEKRFRALNACRRRWFGKPDPVTGLYIHGQVGRGKTLLMDLFHASLAETGIAADRIHFNRFMDQVHSRLKALGNARDPLQQMAAEIARRNRVLCFDEFHVDDIGDAMILGGLIAEMFAGGVTLVATSNTAPERLYAGGLQRARFLPAIENIKAHCNVVELEAAEDFRLRELTRHPVYYSPLDQSTERQLAEEFMALSPGEPVSVDPLTIRGRTLNPFKRAGSVAWFDFAELCRGPRASADYIDLARRFSTLIVHQIPQLTEDDNNATRRFIHLVDECYDRAVKLILSAAVPLASLYAGKRLAETFERTRSRLVEMQSREYLSLPHRP